MLKKGQAEHSDGWSEVVTSGEDGKAAMNKAAKTSGNEQSGKICDKATQQQQNF